MTDLSQLISYFLPTLNLTRTDKKEYILIVLDANNNSSEEYQQFNKQCQALTTSIRTFTDPNSCIDFIHNQPDQQDIVLVVSLALAQDTIPLAHPSPQLSRIYVHLSNQPDADTKWMNDYDKVKDHLFDNLQGIFDHLRGPIRSSTIQDMLGFSFVSQAEIQAGNRQHPTFMYQQLLKDLLLNDHQSDRDSIARKQMVEYCRQVYATQRTQLPIIEEFAIKFQPQLSFFWYTRECFLYEIVNKALRSSDPVALYKLRYFIRHLHAQISSTAVPNGTLTTTVVL